MINIDDKIYLKPRFSLSVGSQPLLSCPLTAIDHIKSMRSREVEKRRRDFSNLEGERCCSSYDDNDSDNMMDQQRDKPILVIEDPLNTAGKKIAKFRLTEFIPMQFEWMQCLEEYKNNVDEKDSRDHEHIRSDVDSKQEDLGSVNSGCHYANHFSSCYEKRRIEGIFRLTMSSWTYKINDFVGVGRHITAVAFNYLDRFTAKKKQIW